MGGFARRFRAGERQHFGDDAGRKRSPPGLARLVAQETIDPFLAVALLPAPNGRAADAGLIGDCKTGKRSAERRTIRARCPCLSGRRRSLAMASKRSRSSVARMTLTVWAIPQTRTNHRICESYVCVSALSAYYSTQSHFPSDLTPLFARFHLLRLQVVERLSRSHSQGPQENSLQVLLLSGLPRPKRVFCRTFL